MKIHWHKLSFKHSCGLAGTIIEVCVSRDGGITINGLCVVCGDEFSTEDTFANLIGKATMSDYLRHRAETPDDMLADFVPKGKPS